MDRRIRVLIVDDHPATRRGLATFLGSEPGMEVVDEAVDGIDAINKALSNRPDVVLMDLRMPRKSGIEATFEITRTDPLIHVLILSVHGDQDSVNQAVRAGALGFVLKGATPQILVDAIHNVAGGMPVFHPPIAGTLAGD